MLACMVARYSFPLALAVALIVSSLAACTPSDPPTPTRTPQSPTPSVQVMAPTVSSVASPLPTSPPVTATPTRMPEPDYVPVGQIQDTASIRHVSLKGNIFSLEIADTPDERSVGLMNREFLPQDAGMLFVFDGEEVLSFWMRNTLIPLDILYMDFAGVVVDIQTMIPQPGVSVGELRTYPSAAPAQYALEINAGLAEQYGFMVGDLALFR